MAASGEVGWPPLGRNRWPLTAPSRHEEQPAVRAPRACCPDGGGSAPAKTGRSISSKPERRRCPVSASSRTGSCAPLGSRRAGVAPIRISFPSRGRNHVRLRSGRGRSDWRAHGRSKLGGRASRRRRGSGSFVCCGATLATWTARDDSHCGMRDRRLRRGVAPRWVCVSLTERGRHSDCRQRPARRRKRESGTCASGHKRGCSRAWLDSGRENRSCGRDALRPTDCPEG